MSRTIRTVCGEPNRSRLKLNYLGSIRPVTLGPLKQV
jgi:hypothetical protein